ncbi:hypothetical protein A0H81_09260 [Grifola frondosa]|uniref:Uncharacterized protein n=1 Tax=Grifola frondosa TaxID=5627 RepID=A0A1C7M714_GRIFR|nr:hypothetical protein A0H81_09260 [Grifola frondosa]
MAERVPQITQSKLGCLQAIRRDRDKYKQGESDENPAHIPMTDCAYARGHGRAWDGGGKPQVVKAVILRAEYTALDGRRTVLDERGS